MSSNSTASLTPEMYAAKFMLSSFRHRVLSLFDLQFILVTGQNRNNESLTYGELVSLASEHAQDYHTLTEIWGATNPILTPVKIALSHIIFIDKQIAEGLLDPYELVSDFAKQQPKVVCALAIEITKSLKIVRDS